jgi:hypothetical protein
MSFRKGKRSSALGVGQVDYIGHDLLDLGGDLWLSAASFLSSDFLSGQ